MQLDLNFGPTEREQSYYQYVPFSVAREWCSVAVELAYDRSSAVVDLGLLGPGGFRGWSGGARTSAQVAERWATPGYLPGPLAGDWSVFLGLYQVPEEGVKVTVTVGGGPSEPPPAKAWPPVPSDAPTLARPPARPGYRWVAGDFHCHSEHSDGSSTLPELAALARRRGLDFLAVTDHNTVSHFPLLEAAGARYGVTLVPGQEVTTPKGHANCIGEVGWADFRTAPDEWMAKAGSEGGLASLNHPVLGPLSWRQPLSRRPELMELWHASWDRSSTTALQYWASLGRPVPIGGSDFHRPGDMDGTGAALYPGAPTTWVEVPEGGSDPCPSPRSIVEGLRAGSVAISDSPTGPVMVRRGDELVVVGGEGATLVVLADPSQPLIDGRRLGVRGERESFRAGPGTALLMANGRAVALCP
jgi:hypothetical protein